jgi:hypothetical protein
MRNGWCSGDIYEDGKFCSVGALAVELGEPMFQNEDGTFTMCEDGAYVKFNDSKEASILADIITEHYPQYHSNAAEQFEEVHPSYVVWRFNDDQADFGPVEQMFEKAAARYDESIS